MFTCPKCKEAVTTTNTVSLENVIFRRRKCNNCGNVVYTAEQKVDESEDIGIIKFVAKYNGYYNN